MDNVKTNGQRQIPPDPASTNSRWNWLFALFCVVPLILMAAAAIFKLPINPAALFAHVLLCPLVHWLLIGRKNGQGPQCGHCAQKSPRQRASQPK